MMDDIVKSKRYSKEFKILLFGLVRKFKGI